MKLSNLLEGLPEIEISGIALDSRKVQKGDLFFAITGNVKKGSEFIPDAIKNGAIAIIGDEDLSNLSVPYFKVKEIRKVVPLVASRFYHTKPKYVVAVTGTNGKTSIASFVAQLFKKLGHKSATIGTLGVVSDDYNFDFGTTTPDAVEFHKSLQTLAQNGVEAVCFEASSHGLDQHRIDDTKIEAAGFTNLTQDHLDYHKDMEHYCQAKKLLFTNILPKDGIAILNADDSYFEAFADCGRKVWSYGYKGKDIKLIEDKKHEIFLEVFGKSYHFHTNIVGDFQIMNMLCAAGLVIACGFETEKVIPLLAELVPPAGRLDFAGELKNGAKVFVDYAHTPDALEKAILALRPYTSSSLAVVFGCGGDRDKTKRPKMGKIANNLADVIYVTDDNPRTENATTIRAEVMQDCPKGKNIADRAKAIREAIENLKNGDILLIAGKGHEDYQIIGTEKIHFDDKEEAKKIISQS